MGKRWDASGVAFNPDTWAAFGEVLHPGAFVMAFASSRGWHRLACAIEDAGFVIHPSVFMLGWSNGAGFPKATRVKDAPAFNGHRYGLQALKPALEPIIVAQKPYAGKPVECITRTGAGSLWVDGGRVGVDGGTRKGTFPNAPSKGVYGDGLNGACEIESLNAGRWPANLVLDDAGAAAIDAQSDCSASRFFQRIAEQIDEADPVRYVAKASRRERDAGLQGMPERAASPQNTPRIETRQRNVHPTLKPLALARYLATLLLPPAEYAPRRLFNPFGGVMSEAIGAALAGWDEVVSVEMMNDPEHNYVELGRARVAYWASKEPML
jgi:site-specific DNA-methyltransferase (adenine-specific)